MLAAGHTGAGLYDGVQELSVGHLAALRAERAEALRTRLRAAGDLAQGAPRASLGEYPVLRGADFAAEVDAHPPFGRFQLELAPFIRTALTTAAVPRPTPIAWTRADLDAEARLGARALRRTGLGSRGRSSDCLEGGLLTPGTLAVSDALE